MNNNKLYKKLFLLFNFLFAMLLYHLFSFVDGRYYNFSSIEKYAMYFVGNFILYKSIQYLVCNKKYKKRIFNILATIASLFVIICFVILMYDFLRTNIAFEGTFESIILLIAYVSPILPIISFSKLIYLKREIKSKKYFVLVAISSIYFLFQMLMFEAIFPCIGYNSFFDILYLGSLISMFVIGCLFNVYTLLVVRETNKENMVKK